MKKQMKILLAVIFVGGGLFLVLVAGLFVEKYSNWKFNNTLLRLRNLQIITEKADYEAAMADTYGGKTPQETLKLYIAAIEKSDYILASKYFIASEQQKQLASFEGAKTADKNNYLKILKGLGSPSYNQNKTAATMKASIEGPDFFARFRQYPNKIWKIVAI